MPGPSRKAILAQIVAWHRRHSGATSFFNPARWSKDSRIPKFIRDLEGLFKPEELSGYLAIHVNSGVPIEELAKEEQEADEMLRAHMDQLFPDETPEFTNSQDTKESHFHLLFLLESRTLRNSMSARSTGVQSLWSATFESNSGQVHRALEKQLDEVFSSEEKAAYQKIMRYMFLDEKQFNYDEFTQFLTKIKLRNQDPKNAKQQISLQDVANLCEEAQHKGELSDLLKDPGNYRFVKNISPRELGVHVHQDHIGHGYWQFSPLTPTKPASKRAKLTERPYRILADLGVLDDHGLLSNQLINHLGRQILASLKEKSQRAHEGHPFSSEKEILETADIQVKQWMIDGIRAFQDLELLFNSQGFDCEQTKALIIMNLQELERSIETAMELLGEDSQARALYDNYKNKIALIINKLSNPAQAPIDTDELLALEKECLHIIFEATPSIDWLITDYQLQHKTPITHEMTNRVPPETPDLKPIIQQENGLFALQLVDRCSAIPDYVQTATTLVEQAIDEDQRKAAVRFRMFADFGRMPDHGLLSNKMINHFGKHALIGLKDKAERHAKAALLSPRDEALESCSIQLNRWMVDGARCLQHLDLLLNCDEMEPTERAIFFKKQANATLDELDSLIKRVERELGKAGGFAHGEEEIYQRYLDTLNSYKSQVQSLLSKPKYQSGDFSHGKMLSLQQNLYRGLLRQYQIVQGHLGAKQNFFFESYDNSVLFREAQFIVQDFNMAYGIEITEDMLNRGPKPGEKVMDFGEMQQTEFGLFAAQIVDSCETELTGTPSSDILIDNLAHPDRLVPLAQRYERVKEDIEKASRDSGIRAKYNSLAVRTEKVLYDRVTERPWYSLWLHETEASKKSRALGVDTLTETLRSDIRKQAAAAKAVEPSLTEREELLKLARVKGRSSVEAIKLNDLGSGAVDFFKDFFGYFDRLGAQRPFVMAGAFSIPYMQFGFAALGLMGSGAIIAHLQALSLAIAKVEAGALNLAHIPVTGAEINHMIEVIDKGIIHATGTEGAFEALITAGFIPAKIIFVMADSILNAGLSSKQGQDWLAEVRNKYDKLDISDKVAEQQFEEGVKSILALTLQLSLAVAAGIGVHMILASNITALRLLATPIGTICNVNPEIFGGPILGNLVQKLFTTKTAGIIYVKISEMIERVEKSQNNRFSSLNTIEIEGHMSALRTEAIKKFLATKDMDEELKGLLKNFLTTDEKDIKDYAGLIARIDHLRASEIGNSQKYATETDNGQLTALGTLLMTVDLSYQIANSNPKPDPKAAKINELNELVRTKQLRNAERQVMEVNDADHKTLAYFLELINAPDACLPKKDDDKYIQAKAQFENLLFENPNLWRLFEDKKSVDRLNQLNIQRHEFSPLSRLGRFLWKDLIMRYLVGTIASPFTALVVLHKGNKDGVVYPFRQFLGTTFFPALFKTLMNVFIVPALIFDVVSNLISHGFNGSKWNFRMTKEIPGAWLNGINNFALIVKGALGAFIMPFLYIVARVPELIVSLLTTNPLTNLAQGVSAVVLLVPTIIGAVIPGLPALLVGGFAKLLGFDKFASQCFNLFKAPLRIPAGGMRVFNDWRESSTDTPGPFRFELHKARAWIGVGAISVLGGVTAVAASLANFFVVSPVAWALTTGPGKYAMSKIGDFFNGVANLSQNIGEKLQKWGLKAIGEWFNGDWSKGIAQGAKDVPKAAQDLGGFTGIMKSPWIKLGEVNKAMVAIAGDENQVSQFFDKIRATAQGWLREQIRYPMEKRIDNFFKGFRDLFRKSEQATQERIYELAEKRENEIIDLATSQGDSATRAMGVDSASAPVMDHYNDNLDAPEELARHVVEEHAPRQGVTFGESVIIPDYDPHAPHDPQAIKEQLAAARAERDGDRDPAAKRTL
jgi:hypothetical protein